MFPHNFSSYEPLGRLRNPEELKAMERQERMLKARVYQYGDPVNQPNRDERDHKSIGLDESGSGYFVNTTQGKVHALFRLVSLFSLILHIAHLSR